MTRTATTIGRTIVFALVVPFLVFAAPSVFGQGAPPNPLFLPPVLYPSGSGAPSSVVVADLNGDGNPDLVVADCGTQSGCPPEGTVGVLLGNGDGTFKPVVTYGTGGGGSSVTQAVVADINGDGKLDIVVSSSCSIGNCTQGSVGVLLGNGDGTFQPALASTGAGGALAVVNIKGKADIIVTTAAAIAVADLNGDGKLDLVTGSLGSPLEGSVVTLGVMLGNGDGTFQPPTSYTPGGSNHVAIAIRDVNGDGKPDIVIAEGVPGGGFLGTGVVAVLLGNGDGSFAPPTTYAAGGLGIGGIALADVSQDGKADAIVATLCPTQFLNPCLALPSDSMHVLRGNGDGTFQAPTTYNSDGPNLGSLFVIQLAVADFNGDGLRDVAVAQCVDSSCNSNEIAMFLHVGATSTATSLSIAPNPSSFWQPVTLRAVVTSASGVPTGTVTFFDGSNPLGTANLISGSASFSWSFLSSGSHSITAVYSGSLQFHSSRSSTRVLTVNPALTVTSLVSSRNPVPLNTFVKYTATVTTQNGGPVSGTITFFDGNTILSTVPLNNNQASCHASYSTGGAHLVAATYSGNQDNRASTSAVLTEYTPVPTSTSFTTSPNPSVFGQKVTFTATVTTTGFFTPGGVVSFQSPSGIIASVSLNSSGVATLVKASLNAAVYPVSAVYRGNGYNQGSTSSVINQVVQQATSAAQIASSLNPSTVGQPVTFTAKITSPTVIPYGSVTFAAGNTVLGTVPLSAGKATLTTSSLPAGSTVIAVTYPGDTNIAKSSTSITQVVH